MQQNVLKCVRIPSINVDMRGKLRPPTPLFLLIPTVQEQD